MTGSVEDGLTSHKPPPHLRVKPQRLLHLGALHILHGGMGLVDAAGAEEDGGDAEAGEFAGVAAEGDAAGGGVAAHAAQDVAGEVH